MMSRPWRSRRTNELLSRLRKLPRPVANSRPTTSACGMGQTRLMNLRYTLPALADLDSILDHIAAQSHRIAGAIWAPSAKRPSPGPSLPQAREEGHGD